MIPDDPIEPLEDEDPEGEGPEGDEAQPEGSELGAEAEPAPAPEPEEEVLHPDTPVPPLEEMRAALEWAFTAGEEDVESSLLDLYARHALQVLEKNRVMNLTAILDPKEMAVKHYLDSWRITKLVPLIARKVLDLGSGAGFPGLPVALAEPNLSMTLVDSTQKKADFLMESLKDLPVKNAIAVGVRAEDYLTTERVDVVLVRAVSSVRENVRTLRKVRHSLKDLVMLKGNSWSREVRAAEREAERLGFKLDTVWEHELPDEMGQRAILVYRAPGGAGL